MEQRRLRLGDIIDDYCPRERRLTNHAVVALVGDEVKQTRCSTCDAEHVYKQARVPARRKKAEAAAIARPPADAKVGVEGDDAMPPDAPGAETTEVSTPVIASPPVSTAPGALAAAPADTTAATGDPDPALAESAPGHDDYWPAHRRLIRATLPRTVSDTPSPRQAPDFTLRLPGARLGPLRDTDFGFKSPSPPKGGKKNGRPGRKHQRGHAGADHASGRNGNTAAPQGQHAARGRRGRHHGKPR